MYRQFLTLMIIKCEDHRDITFLQVYRIIKLQVQRHSSNRSLVGETMKPFDRKILFEPKTRQPVFAKLGSVRDGTCFSELSP